eukprot:SAG11_NODE_218_length_12212_cov_7.026005_15_plen_75_part_00
MPLPYVSTQILKRFKVSIKKYMVLFPIGFVPACTCMYHVPVQIVCTRCTENCTFDSVLIGIGTVVLIYSSPAHC